MPGRYTGTIGKSFSGDRDKARSRQGAAQVLVQSLMDRIKNSPMKGRGLLTGKKYLADGSTIWAMVNTIGIVPIVRTWVDAPVNVSVSAEENLGFYMIMYYRNIGMPGVGGITDEYANNGYSLQRVVLRVPDTPTLTSANTIVPIFSEPMYGHPEYAATFADGGEGTVLCAYSGSHFIYKKYDLSDRYANDNKYVNTSYYDQRRYYDESIGSVSNYKAPLTFPVDVTPTTTDIIRLYYDIRTKEPDSGIYVNYPRNGEDLLTADGYTIPVANETCFYSIGVKSISDGETVEIKPAYTDNEGNEHDAVIAHFNYDGWMLRRFNMDCELLSSPLLYDLLTDVGFVFPGGVFSPRQAFDTYVAAKGIDYSRGTTFYFIGSECMCGAKNSLYLTFAQVHTELPLPPPPPQTRFPRLHEQSVHIVKLDEVDGELTLAWQSESATFTDTCFDKGAAINGMPGGSYLFGLRPSDSDEVYNEDLTFTFGRTDSPLYYSPRIAANSSYYALMFNFTLVVGDVKTGAVKHLFHNPFGDNISIASMAWNKGILWVYLVRYWAEWTKDSYKLVGLNPSKWDKGELGVVFEVSQSDIKRFLDKQLPDFASDFQIAGCTFIQNPIGGDA